MSRIEERRPPQQLTITLPPEAINLMLAILARAPFEQVADLIMSIRMQAQQQIQPQDGGEE